MREKEIFDSPLSNELPDAYANFDALDQGGEEGIQEDMQYMPEERMDEMPEPRKEHFRNLIYEIPEQIQSQLTSKIIENIENDIESKRSWEEKGKKAIILMGYDTTKYKDKLFLGSTGVFSSAFSETVHGILNVFRGEILPPEGPADFQILGIEDDAKEERVTRVKAYTNYYLTRVSKSYYSDKEQCALNAILNGSSFSKTYIDPLTNIAVSPFINPEDFIVNAKATNLANARIAQRFTKTEKEVKQLQLKGIWKNIPLSEDNSAEYDNDPIKKERQEVTKIRPDNMDDQDKLWTFYEAHIDVVIPGFEYIDKDGNKTDLPLPFIFTVHATSRTVLSIVCNWQEDDPNYKRIEIFTQWKFAPGLDFFGSSLLDVCGGNAEVATELLREIKNSIYLSNYPCGFVAATFKQESPEIQLSPLKFTQLDTNDMAINDVVQTLPFKEASPMAKAAKDDAEASIMRMGGVLTNAIANFNENIPVGTTLALLGEINRPQSSIMRRFHESMANELEIFYELLPDTLPDGAYPFDVKGNSHEIVAQDFNNDLRIIPISDPTMCSSMQRLMRAQELRRLSMETPEQFNSRAITKMICTELRIDPELIMSPEQQEEEILPLDPISTCMNIMAGKPVKAFIDQDHQAYLIILSNLEQQLMQDPENNADKIAALKALKQEHEIFIYQLQMEQMLGYKLPDDPAQLPPEMQHDIALKIATVLQQQQQQQQENEPAAITPEQVMMEDVEVKRMGVESRARIDEMKLQLETFKIEEEMAREKERIQLETYKAQSKDELDRLKTQSKENFDFMKAEYDLKLKEQELSLKQAQFELETFKAEAELSASHLNHVSQEIG